MNCIDESRYPTSYILDILRDAKKLIFGVDTSQRLPDDGPSDFHGRGAPPSANPRAATALPSRFGPIIGTWWVGVAWEFIFFFGWLP